MVQGKVQQHCKQTLPSHSVSSMCLTPLSLRSKTKSVWITFNKTANPIKPLLFNLLRYSATGVAYILSELIFNGLWEGIYSLCDCTRIQSFSEWKKVWTFSVIIHQIHLRLEFVFNANLHVRQCSLQISKHPYWVTYISFNTKSWKAISTTSRSMRPLLFPLPRFSFLGGLLASAQQIGNH